MNAMNRTQAPVVDPFENLVVCTPPSSPRVASKQLRDSQSPKDVRRMGNSAAAIPRNNESKTSIRTSKQSQTLSPRNKSGVLPWQRIRRHRKSQSLSTPSTIMQAIYPNKEPSLTKSSKESDGSAPTEDISSTLKELWEVQKMTSNGNTFDSLELPSLAKPRLTSFLTGEEDTQRTCPIDSSPWQVELPSKLELETCVLTSQFLETYQTEECFLKLEDLVGISGLDLKSFSQGNHVERLESRLHDCHRPTVEALLECGRIHGVAIHMVSENREVLVLEQDRQFLCVFQGTPNEQVGRLNMRHSEMVKAGQQDKALVCKEFVDALGKFERELFSELDDLLEKNPFYDICFSGHSFGGGVATLAGYRYAFARQDLRVSVLVSGCPKVGQEDFCRAGNSIANLRLFRLEHNQVRSVQGQPGHTIRINPLKKKVTVHRFESAGTNMLHLKKTKSVTEYALSLEELGEKWAGAFYGHDGEGIRGAAGELRDVS